MKLKLLTLAVASTVILPAMQANAEDFGPQLYGKINASLNYNDREGQDGDFDLQDNASRVGVKGEEDLGGISGVYQIEFGASVSDGSGLSSNRNSFVGLKGDFGTVFVGKHDSPFKLAQGKIDLFNDTDLDLGLFLGGEEREANVLGWKSVDMGGFSVFAQFQPGENPDDGTNTPAGNDGEYQDSIADGVSVMAQFKTDMLYVAAAYDMNATWGSWSDYSSYSIAQGRTDAFRITGGMDMDMFGFTLMFQSAELADVAAPAKETGFLVSGYVMADQTKFKAAYGQSDHEQEGQADIDLAYYAVGVDQMLSKRTTLFANYGNLNTEVSTNGVSAGESDDAVFMVGAVHNF